MKFTVSHFVFILTIACLCAMGIAFLYSTGYLGEGFAVRGNYLRQCFFIGAGALIAICISRLRPGGALWRITVFCGYGISVLLLLLVLMMGKSIGGARRWLDFGPILLQPAEFARAFAILAAAFCLDGKSLPRRWEFVAGVSAFLLPMVLIILEPSYGNAFSLAFPMAAMLGCRFLPKWLWGMSLFLGVIILIGCSLGIQRLRMQDGNGYGEAILAGNNGGEELSGGFLRLYHLRRLKSFLSAEGGWNEQQSVMAVAGGGLIGKGYLNGTMKNLGFLPRTVAPTDFIFAVVAEEGGFLFGVLPLLLLYWLLLMTLMHWAARAQDRLSLNLIAGGSIMLFTHILVGVGMSIRLLPVIGLPLPLLSYGGSFTVAVFILLGAMFAADRHRSSGENTPSEDSEGTGGFSLGRVLRVNVTRASQ